MRTRRNKCRIKLAAGTGIALFLLLLCPKTGICVHAGNAVFEKEDDVYLIQSAQDMRTLALLVNGNKEVEHGVSAHNASYLLTRDIDLSPYCTGEGGWEPIGSGVGYFDGTFDGGNHVITGLYINRPEEQGQGLFGQRIDLRGSELSEEEQQARETTIIKNLYLKDCDVTGSGNVGGVMGGMWNFIQDEGGDLFIENCHVTGKIKASGWAGGIVGDASTVKNSSFTGTVEASNAGGIAANAYYIDGCAVHATVDGFCDVGGVGGMAVCVRNSYISGSVSGYDSVGGITGMGACLTGCYTIADVAGYSRTGGLIGDIQSMNAPCPEGASSACTIQNCLMGGYRLERVREESDASIYYPTNDRYNGYICGFPGVGIDDRATGPFFYREGLETQGFGTGTYDFFTWNCMPCDCTHLEETDFKELLGKPEEGQWSDVWFCAADYAWPNLSWEKDSRFGYTTVVTVQKGDSLWKIAEEIYGNGDFWELIYEQNQERIGDDPNLIVFGTELKLTLNASLADYAAKGEPWSQEKEFREKGQELGFSKEELKRFYRRVLADDLWNGDMWKWQGREYDRQINTCVIADLDGNGQKDMIVMAGEGSGMVPGVIWLYLNEEPVCVLKDEKAYYEDDFCFGFGFWNVPWMADIDNDGRQELLFEVFNGGNGGSGGRDICLFRHVGNGWKECLKELPNDRGDSGSVGLHVDVICTDPDRYEAYCPYLDESIEFDGENTREIGADEFGRVGGSNVRGFYDLKCVKYKEKNALQCRECLSGEGGNAHGVGDAVFILVWDAGGVCRVADWWIEEYD